MKKVRSIFTVLMFVLICSVLFVFVACGETDGDGKCTEHTYGEWTLVSAGNCKNPSVEKRICKKCKAEETRDGEKDPNVHFQWTEWECDMEATCEDDGHEFRICLGCNETEENIIPKDDSKHVFGVWTVTKAATCSKQGERVHTCTLCNTDVTEKTPLDDTNHRFVSDGSTPSTCSTHGTNNSICADCGKTDFSPLPFDTHFHSSPFVNGVCPDCGGMLDSDIKLDNETGKLKAIYSKFFEGDFKVQYEFYTKAGQLEPQWDNFLFEIAPAINLAGTLNKSDVGLIQLIPYPRGRNHFTWNSLWWNVYPINVDSTWFFDENGTDLIYETCVQKGIDVIATFERVGDYLSVKYVMTVEMNGKNYDCVVTTDLTYPGIEKFYIGLSGEECTVDLKQVTLLKGAIASERVEPEEGKALIDSPVVFDNSGVKNANGLDYTFTGDFDIEYDLTLAGDDVNDWYSWILYMFADSNDLTVAEGHKLYYSATANSSYPEPYAPTFVRPVDEDGKPVNNGNYQFRHDLGDLASNLKDSKAKLRIVRKGGQINVYGYGYKNTDDIFVYYLDAVKQQTYSGKLTIRITGEKCNVTVTGATLYCGTATQPNGQCIKHDLTEWDITEADRCKPGHKERECKDCDYSESEILPAVADHDYGDWVKEYDPVCGTPGREKQVCSVCKDEQYRDIPATGVHSFGEWTVTKQATCTDDGEERRDCELCDHFETRVIDATGHSYGAWDTTDATCIAAGERHRTCSVCDDVESEKLPKDLYAHSGMTNGICPDCHGILTAQKDIDNTAGKKLVSDEIYLGGDFEIVYTFKNNFVGTDKSWDNFIMSIDQAEYVNGKIIHPSVRNKAGDAHGEFDMVPFMTNNDAAGHFGLFWNKFGNSVDMTWFKGPNGEAVSFQDAMAASPNVVANIKKTDNKVTATFTMIANVNGTIATCTVTYHIYVGAANKIWLSLSGEECVLNVSQIKLLAGEILPATSTEQGTSVLDTPAQLANANKNDQGLNITFDEGDFDFEYRYESAENPGKGDWDNWLFYMFKDNDDFAIDGNNGHKLYWSMTVNGAEPEASATVFQNVNWCCFNKRDYDSFAAQVIKHCTFNIRVARRNGYISVIGDGWLDGENTPFVQWAYNTYTITYNGMLTIRLTSQKSTLTVNDVIVYSGSPIGINVAVANGMCVSHALGEWNVTPADRCIPGHKERACNKCSYSESEVIPGGEHTYGEWTTDIEPVCGTPGNKHRTCSVCNNTEEQEIPATGTHTYGEWTGTAANCMEAGERSRTCSGCGNIQNETLPVDVYTHRSALDSNGVCPDCHGMLTAARVVDNTAGKALDTYGHYFNDDFDLTFEFDGRAGSNSEWHNFIMKLAPAYYADGQIRQSPVGRIMLLPFPKNRDHYCGPETGGLWWKTYGITVNTTGFYDKDHVDLGYAASVQKGFKAVVTLKRMGDNVDVRMVMTIDHNGEAVDCVVTTTLAYPGVENLYVGITGESSSLTLNQFKINDGAFAPSAEVATGTQILESPVELNNSGVKNQAALNYAFDGDFDVMYDLDLKGDDVNDWHSWILYMFKDSDDFTIDGNNGHKLFFCGTANGNYSEGSVPTMKKAYNSENKQENYNFRIDSGNFAANLQNSKVKLRIVRKNGQINIYGYGYKEDGTEIVQYVDSLNVNYTGTLTLRMTAELCVCTVTGLTVYNGTPTLIA